MQKEINKNQSFSILKRLKSFKYAFNGLKILLKEEHNSRIHFFAALCAVILGLILNISNGEWIAIVLAIGFVFTLEIINSAIENISDFISPEKNDQIKKIKDFSAGGVLIGALASLIIGMIIFIPKILSL